INVFQGRRLRRLVQKLGLPCTGYFDENGTVYEAQYFASIVWVVFFGLLITLYPLTAPRLNKWIFLPIAIIVRVVAEILLTIFRATCSSQRLLRWWQIALSTCAVGFGLSIFFLWLFSAPDRFPTLAVILL